MSPPNESAAAQYCPAIYWYSMLEIPGKDQFGGASDIPTKITQQEWLTVVKNRSRNGCHQLGGRYTRTIPAQFGTGAAAWMRRTQSGQAGANMTGQLAGKLAGVPYKYFGDWTDRVARGELPHAKPARPQGMERNIVVTVRDWHTEKHYLHDLISTDRRNPTVNARGPLYGSAEFSTDAIPILDPVKNIVTALIAPAMKGTTFARASHALAKPVMPSAYWGDEVIWNAKTSNHNPMFDEDGRVWFAARVRDANNPAFCRKGSDHPSAKLTAPDKRSRHLSVLDPRTMKYSMVDTCFGTHHPQFDKKGILWTSGGRSVIGWLDAKKFPRTGDAAASTIRRRAGRAAACGPPAAIGRRG